MTGEPRIFAQRTSNCWDHHWSWPKTTIWRSHWRRCRYNEDSR